MQQSQPVARLVHGRFTHVVAVGAAAGHRLRGDVAAVGDVGGRVGLEADVGGEGAAAEDATGEVSLEVDVEGGVSALAEGGFHGCVVGGVGAGGPSVVGGEGGVVQGEGYAVGFVV